MNAYLAVTALVLAWNAPPPPEAPQPPAAQENRIVAPLIIKNNAIRGEGRSIQAKILIPRNLLAGNAEAVKAAASVPGLNPAASSREVRSTTPALNTVIAGLAISLAMVSLVFVLRGNRITKVAAVAALAVSMVLTGIGILRADIPGPGPRPVRPTPIPVRPNSETEIVIEITDPGETVTLLLTR